MNEQLPSTDPHKKLGKWMLAMAWIAGLVVLTLFFDDQLFKRYNPNADPITSVSAEGSEVRLRRNRLGHYVSSGEINGAPVIFLLDTGATNVSIPAHLSNELGLRPGRLQRVQTANGSLQVAATQIGELRLGNIVLRNVDANLNPGMDGDQILLGMSALKHLEFTQRGDWLILRSL